MSGCTTRRGRGNDIATHFVIGRSSTKLPAFLMKMPTETGSMWIGPSVRRWATTASNTGRSWRPVEKYSSMVIAGSQSWLCPRRAKWRLHDGHTQPFTPPSSQVESPCTGLDGGTTWRQRLGAHDVVARR